jgi:hypothetical protein
MEYKKYNIFYLVKYIKHSVEGYNNGIRRKVEGCQDGKGYDPGRGG